MDSIDRIFAESVRKAIMDFGEDIILERRLIGILKDYHGFWTFPPAEYITRLLIDTGNMRNLLEAKGGLEGRTADMLRRLISTYEKEYGFDDKILKRTFFSLLDGIGVLEWRAWLTGKTEQVSPGKTEHEESFTTSSTDTDYEEELEENGYSFKEVRRKLKKLIAIKFDIPRKELRNDTTLDEIEELGGYGFDMNELIEEIEDEFEIFLDSDLLDEFMTINELTSEIMDMLDD